MSEHIVRPGDSLWKIAADHGVTLAQLIAANPSFVSGGRNPNVLWIGESIHITDPTLSNTNAAAKPVQECRGTGSDQKNRQQNEANGKGLNESNVYELTIQPSETNPDLAAAKAKLAKDPNMKSMWRQIDAPIKNVDDDRNPDAYASVIDQFDVENSHKQRYRPDDKYTDTRCNIFAGDVMRAMGVPFPTKGELKGKEDPMTANAKDVSTWLASEAAKGKGWREIDVSTPEGLTELKEHVNGGKPAIASDSGHVCVIRPNQSASSAKDLAITQAGAKNMNNASISATGYGTPRFQPKFYVHE